MEVLTFNVTIENGRTEDDSEDFVWLVTYMNDDFEYSYESDKIIYK